MPFRLNGGARRDEYGITYIIFTIEEIMNLDESGKQEGQQNVEGAGGAWLDLPKTPGIGKAK